MTDSAFDIPDIPGRLPKGKRGESILAQETAGMERNRRLVEQDGHRQLTRVKARDHGDDLFTAGPEEALDNGILPNPLLADSQRFDGVDVTVTPLPAHADSKTRMKYDNERNKQLAEKQLKKENELTLANRPSNAPSSAPTPRPK